MKIRQINLSLLVALVFVVINENQMKALGNYYPIKQQTNVELKVKTSQGVSPSVDECIAKAGSNQEYIEYHSSGECYSAATGENEENDFNSIGGNVIIFKKTGAYSCVYQSLDSQTIFDDQIKCESSKTCQFKGNNLQCVDKNVIDVIPDVKPEVKPQNTESNSQRNMGNNPNTENGIDKNVYGLLKFGNIVIIAMTIFEMLIIVVIFKAQKSNAPADAPAVTLRQRRGSHTRLSGGSNRASGGSKRLSGTSLSPDGGQQASSDPSGLPGTSRASLPPVSHPPGDDQLAKLQQDAQPVIDPTDKTAPVQKEQEDYFFY